MGRHLLRALDAALPLAAAWFVYRAPDPLHTWLVTEDGFLEWLQVAALALTVAVLLARASRTRSLSALAGAGLAFFVAGEEVAWGSRLLDLSGTAIQEANRQGELTLHNLDGGLTASFMAVAIAGLVGAVWVVRRHLPLAVWFAAPALYAAARVTHTGVISPRAAKISEALELALYVAVARAVTRPPRPSHALEPVPFPLTTDAAGRSL